MKKLFVILLLLVTLNATSQNKTVVLKVASVDAANYLTKADSLSGGYTTWLRTKKVVDSLAALKVNYTDTAAMMAASPRVNRFLDSLTNVQARIQTKSPIAGSSSLTTVGTLSSGSIPYSLLTGTPSLDYLPLTGGTLTGPLSGTSATFSGKISSTSTGILLERLGASTSNQWLRFQNTGGSFIAGIESSAGGSLIIGSTAYDGAVTAPTGLSFSANDGTNLHLRIASTGAATFASRVNVNGATDDGTTALKVTGAGTFSGSVLSGTTSTDIGGSVTGAGLFATGKILSSNAMTDVYSAPIYSDRRGTNNIGAVYQLAMGGFFKADIGIDGTNGVTNDAAITFNTWSGNNIRAERARINTSGLSVTGTLGVTGALSGTSATFTTGGTTTVRIKGNSTTGFDLQNDAGGAYLWNRDNTSMYFATNNTQRLEIASTGQATFSSSLGINGVADNVKSGTYTPTLTNYNLVSAATAYQCQYMRVGNVVTVSGKVSITATNPGNTSSIYMSVPISSTLGTDANAGGTFGLGGNDPNGVILAGTTDTVLFSFVPSSTANNPYWFTFTYLIN